MRPLGTQASDLLPVKPAPKAVPFVWEWSSLIGLAERAGELVPVGMGGERRAIGLVNPRHNSRGWPLALGGKKWPF